MCERAAQRVRAQIDRVVNMMFIRRNDAWPTSPSVSCITMPKDNMYYVQHSDEGNGMTRGDVGGELMHLNWVIIDRPRIIPALTPCELRTAKRRVGLCSAWTSVRVRKPLTRAFWAGHSDPVMPAAVLPKNIHDRNYITTYSSARQEYYKG